MSLANIGAAASKTPEQLAAIGAAAVHYVDVQIGTLRRLVARFARLVKADEKVPDDVIAESMHEIHVQYCEAMRFAQMVVGDSEILTRVENCRAPLMREAFDAIALRRSFRKVREIASRMKTTRLAADPTYAPSLVKCAAGLVEV